MCNTSVLLQRLKDRISRVWIISLLRKHLLAKASYAFPASDFLIYRMGIIILIGWQWAWQGHPELKLHCKIWGVTQLCTPHIRHTLGIALLVSGQWLWIPGHNSKISWEKEGCYQMRMGDLNKGSWLRGEPQPYWGSEATKSAKQLLVNISG